MAHPYQGEGRGHLRDRYAPAGYPPGQRPDGNLHCGSGAADSLIRGPEREGEHPQAPSGRHRRGKGQRGAVWPSGDRHAR